MHFEYFPYSQMNARQKENHNFQRVTAVLAWYGYSTVRLTDDWLGADFLAMHADGQTILRVQLKSRLCFNKGYQNRDLWLCFPEGDGAYLFPHDSVLKMLLNAKRCIQGTISWNQASAYSMKRVPKWLKPKLAKYFLSPPTSSNLPEMEK